MNIPPADPGSEPLLSNVYGDPHRIMNIFTQFIAVILLGMGAGIIINLSEGDSFAVVALVVCIVPILVALYFARRKQFELAANFLAVILISLITIVVTNNQGIHQISVLAYPAILIIANLVIRKRTVVLLTLYNIACVAWLVFGEYFGIYTPAVPTRSTPGDFFVAAIVLVATAYMVRLITETLFDNNLRLQKELKERKEAEKALHESMLRQSAILDNIPDLAWLKDEEGRFIAVNGPFGQACGVAPKDLAGKTDLDIWPEELAQAYRKDDFEVMQTGKRKSVEERLVDSAGQENWIQTIKTPIFNDFGQIMGTAGIARDITERRNTEDALRESEIRYRAIVESTTDLMCRFLPDTTLTFVNTAYCQYFGKDPRELVGMRFLEMIPREGWTAVQGQIDAIIARKEPYTYEHEVVTPNGEVRWQQWTDSPILDASGQVVELQSVGRDTTELKHAEYALKHSQRRLSTALRATKVGVWEWDMHTNKAFWSDENYRVLGLEPFTVESRYENWAKCVHPEDLPAAEEKITEAINNKSELNIEFRVIWPDGSVHWINDIGDLLLDEDTGEPLGMYGIQMDITERKRAEQVLRESENLLREIAANYPNSYISIIEKDLTVGLTSGQEFKKQGLDPAQFVGRTLEQVFGEHAPLVRENYLKTFEGVEIQFELFINNQFQFYRMVPLVNRDGKIERILTVVENITERKQAEEALKENEAIFSSFLEHSPVYVFFKDKQIRSLRLSRNYEQMLGMPIQDLLGKTMDDLFPSDLAKTMVADDMRILHDGKRISVVEELNGRIYETTKFPVLKDGEPFILAGFTVDITERKQAEDAIKYAEQRYRTLFEEAPVMYVITVNMDGTPFIADCNNMFLNTLGYSRAEVVQQPLAKFYTSASRSELLDGGGYQRALTGSFAAEERELITRDGRVIQTLLHATPEIDSHGKVYGTRAMYVDITERKRSEEEREKLIRELESKNAESEILRESAAAVAFPLEFDDTVSGILDQLKRAVPYDSASVQLLIGNELEIIGERGFPEEKNSIGMRFVLDENNPAYPILRDGLPYILYPNIQLINERFKGFFHDHISGWMAIPLYARGRLIGMFTMGGFTVNKFTEVHARFASIFANQVAVILENSRLYAELQSELKKQIALRGAITAIASSLHLNDVLSEICKRMASAIDATSAYLSNYDSSYSSYTVVAEYLGPNVNELEQVSDLGVNYYRKDGALVFDEKNRISSAIIHADDPDLTPWTRSNLLSFGAKSVLYIPLYVQDRLIGHAELWEGRRKRIFTDEEISFCRAISQQAAIAIENASLFEQLQEEKERAEITLHSIGDAVITTDVKARVEYLNPVAENLTGWKVEEAVGQPLEKVFRIIEEGSRQPALSPVERCLQEGKVAGLANHSILISRDGTEYSIDDSAAPIHNRQGEMIGAVLVFHDVTEERRLSRQVAHDAMHDSLTGLVNRREFERRLERALISAKERETSHILCYLDLDQFKIVNDTAGHAAGDELLRQVAGLLGGLFRQRDTFARLGGDEFGLLLENCQLDQALIISSEIKAKIRDFPFVWAGRGFQVGVSIGVVPITAEKESVNQLLSQADVACYSAKDLGRDRIHVYQAEDSETTQRHSDILQAARMRDAIFHDQFRLFCQPIVQTAGEKEEMLQYEVLLRMADSQGHLVLPSAFIPSAERYGLMPTIDRWVIRETLLSMARHAIKGMLININLSGNSLDDEMLLEFVLGQLNEFSIPPEHICFEITETAAIHHLSKAQQFIEAFRERGGKIALDDFGSGFSSFRYLKTLPIDYIKIDGGFVSDMLSNPGDLLMVEAITQIAHTLRIEVIAEHASNQEIIGRLREIGVDRVQGFGTGRPVPLEEAWRSNMAR